jgi:hypothetical protein
MKPSKPISISAQMGIECISKVRSAPKEIKKLSASYESHLSEDMQAARSLGEIIYKKSVVYFLRKDIGFSASLDAAKRDQFFYEEATNESYAYSEILENARQIQCPESRRYTYMAIVNEVDGAHFNALIKAAKTHTDKSAMQEFFKLIATDKEMNAYRAIKAAKEITHPDEQQKILYALYQVSKGYVQASLILLKIAKLTTNIDLRDQILRDAIAPKSSYSYEFEAQLQAYALLSHKSQSPRTRFQIIEDFFSPDFIHILSTSDNGERSKFAWLTDDLFKSLEPEELDLVVPGLAHSIPAPNKMDQGHQIECVNDISQRIIACFFYDPTVLANFMAALVRNTRINFIVLRKVVFEYFHDKSFDDLLTCFKCLTKQACPQENYKSYTLMWVLFCRSHLRSAQSPTLFQGTTSHVMGQPGVWHIVNEKLPDAADIQSLISSEDLECLARATDIDPEARKYLIGLMHKKYENKEAKVHFLAIIEQNEDILRLNKVKPIYDHEPMEG